MTNEEYIQSLYDKCREVEERVKNGEVLSFVDRFRPYSNLHHYLCNEVGTYIDKNNSIKNIEYAKKEG